MVKISFKGGVDRFIYPSKFFLSGLFPLGELWAQNIVNEEHDYFNDFEVMIEDEVTTEDAMKSDKAIAPLELS